MAAENSLRELEAVEVPAVNKTASRIHDIPQMSSNGGLARRLGNENQIFQRKKFLSSSSRVPAPQERLRV